MPGPLDGVRVVDWTIWRQGPVATAMLGDLGAEVTETMPGMRWRSFGKKGLSERVPRPLRPCVSAICGSRHASVIAVYDPSLSPAFRPTEAA